MATEKRERQRANRQLKYEQQVKEQKRSKLTRRILIGVGAVVGGLALVLFLAWAFGSDSDDDTPAVDSTVSRPRSTRQRRHDRRQRRPANPPRSPTAPVSARPRRSPSRSASSTPRRSCASTRPPSTRPRFVTSQGDIVVDLATADVPGTVNNFVTLARYGFYDDTLDLPHRPEHRHHPGRRRGRTPTRSATRSPTRASGFTYPPGVIAMANTGAPNSAGAQWFFTVGPNSAPTSTPSAATSCSARSPKGLDVAEAILALAPDDGDTPTEESSSSGSRSPRPDSRPGRSPWTVGSPTSSQPSGPAQDRRTGRQLDERRVGE